ncbi:hypothetical protein KP509_20G050900 [Ceratopteris richardii]|nr:hypothetical protein KP509_20G050900 [Ceratopteris richardii]
MGQPDCQFYMKTGTCKYGAQCKYHHPHSQPGSARGPPLFNSVGLPLRPGEKECVFYLRTGLCKFGVACKFHHPDFSGVAVTCSPYPNSTPLPPAPISTWQPIYFPGSGFGGPSYGPMYTSPPQTVPFNSGWTTFQAVGTPLSSGDHRCFFYSPQSQVTPVTTSSDGPLSCSPRIEQEDCQYYLQTGHCKFGASCKYHHPKNMVTPVVPQLSPMGLPLRPGQPLCTFYLRNGICKFGSICRYDHPMRGISISSRSLSFKEAARTESKSKTSESELQLSADAEQEIKEDGVGEVTKDNGIKAQVDGVIQNTQVSSKGGSLDSDGQLKERATDVS